MVKYKPYEKYKDSGVEWIGEVPDHWKKTSFSRLVDSVQNGTTATQVGEETPYPVTRIETISAGKINFNKVGYVEKFPGIEKYRLEHGDILLSHINSLEYVGNCAIYNAGKKLYSGMNLLRIKPQENVDGSWLYQLITSYFFNQTVRSISKPAINQVSVPIGRLKQISTPLPPYTEQQAIANFLDHKTSEIDSLIDDKEKLITLLQEYRQSVISEAVTKGLNPDVKMKDSGIEWIGEIPEHWETLRLKYAANLVNEKATADDLDKPYIGLENIQSWTGLYSLSEDANSDEGTTSNLFAPGMVLFGKLRPYLAKCVKVNFSGRCSTELLTLKPNKVRSDYLHYLLLTDSFISEVDSSTYGAKMPRANWSIISNLKIAIPPQPEQDEITDYLDRKTSEIDTLISGIQGSIEQLKAYRQSLISEAVTGKIDVREFAAEGGAASG